MVENDPESGFHRFKFRVDRTTFRETGDEDVDHVNFVGTHEKIPDLDDESHLGIVRSYNYWNSEDQMDITTYLFEEMNYLYSISSHFQPEAFRSEGVSLSTACKIHHKSRPSVEIQAKDLEDLGFTKQVEAIRDELVLANSGSVKDVFDRE